MSEQAPERASGGKVLGMKPRTMVITGAAILAAALAYFWWQKRKASSASTAASATASAGAYGMDYSGQLTTIQDELEQLLAQQGVPAASGGGGSGSGGSNPPPSSGGGTPPPSSGGGGKGTTQPPGGSVGPKPAIPTGVHATRVAANAVTLAWHKASGATSYRIRVTYQGKLVHESTTAGTSATISGLTPDHTYTFHVASVGPGGTSAETGGPAVKTPR